MPKALPVPVAPFERPDDDEERTVHEVYEAIAPHFARTRFKPWRIIDAFLRARPPGSLGLDAGAGNGKYLPAAAAAGSALVALDRSANLLSIARGIGGECVRADLGAGCWRDGVFDYAISIAAIHHLSTAPRRQHAVRALLRALRVSAEPPYARFMLYVWAYEQGAGSRRKMGSAAQAAARATAGTAGTAGEGAAAAEAGPAAGGTGGGAGDGERQAARAREQDVLVPWVLAGEDKVYHRYYHLFVAGELEDVVRRAAEDEGLAYLEQADSGEAEAGEKGDEEVEDGERPSQAALGGGAGRADGGGIRWVRTVAHGWEADNWWFEGEVGCGPARPQR